MSLSITRLSKRTNNKWLFRDVSLKIDNGEIFGVFGPTGSGKSSLLRTLSGIGRPAGGTMEFDGSDGKDRLYLDNGETSFFGSLFGKKIDSPGLHQARALENTLRKMPRVLLLDSALSEMDAGMRTEMFDRIRLAVRQSGGIAIFASGDFEQILEFCDRAAVLIDGAVTQVDTPQEIYDSPADRRTASIAGRNNIFLARRLTSSKAVLPEFLTIKGEHRLFSQKAELGSLGAINKDTSLMIRPENITIAFGASFPEDNLLKATVTGTLPRGATTIVQLDSNGLALEAMVLRLVGLDVGDECMIGLPPERIRVLAN